MKRVLITGSNGLLGQKIVELFARGNNYNLLLTSKQKASVFDEATLPYLQLDMTQKQEVKNALEEFEPDVVINTAAVTNVDQCETDREAAWKTNVSAVEHLVHTAQLIGAHVIQLSTDYVFDGKSGPYAELDRPNPLSYYGRTKLAAENIIRTSGVSATVVRTMVLYGFGYGVKLNFALWLLKSFTDHEPMKIVDDQFGNPTLADDLAYAILRIVELERKGVYHIAGPDLVSRYDFAVAFAKQFAFDKRLITPIKTSSLRQAAARPLRSGFITLKAQTDLGVRMTGIEKGIAAFRNAVTMQMKQLAPET
ncbi:MAG TPA: dTDP-4-dehydrorhamnose reductase [Bacteroidota bacterium]|nr:dTDP-4-dehydrorhamnose reductase [Bacteroidota bacterium]